MPTQDMERFVELSHREEEEDHHDDEENKEKWAPGAMQATNSGGSFETTGNADRRMMEHSKSHPRMLKSTFSFGCLLFENRVVSHLYTARAPSVRGNALFFSFALTSERALLLRRTLCVCV